MDSPLHSTRAKVCVANARINISQTELCNAIIRNNLNVIKPQIGINHFSVHNVTGNLEISFVSIYISYVRTTQVKSGIGY